MKNKNDLNKYIDDIERVKGHIQKVFPHAKKVEVKIKEDSKVGFKTIIRVKAPLKSNLIAFKADKNFKKSLEKSHHAIVRQIHKVKTRWRREEKRQPCITDLSA